MATSIERSAMSRAATTGRTTTLVTRCVDSASERRTGTRRTMVGALLVTVLVVSAPTVIVDAATGGSGRGNGGGSGSGSGSSTEDTIEAEVRWNTNARDTPGCRWAPVTGVDPVSGTTRELPTTRVVKGESWTLYERACGTRRSLHWVRSKTTSTVATDSHSRVSRLVPTLLVKTAPDADQMVVHVGTWFWVPRQAWRPVSITAMIPTTAGPIIVTTTAIPTLLVYSPGDGNAPVVCRGPGLPWRRVLGDAAVSPCMHTYTRASHTRPGDRYSAKLSVQWTVTWTSNLGVGGALPPIRLGVGTDVRVVELQALSR